MNHLHSFFFSALLSMALLTTSIHAQTVVVNFSDMTPHIGQKLEMRLIDKRTLKEVDRTSLAAITQADFSLSLEGEMGGSYYIDFYADLSQNGLYDAPPTDHAWRIEADNLQAGNNMFSFQHNTNFMDIDWRYMLTLQFSDMTPHIGQMLGVRVRSITRVGKEVGRTYLASIPQADFEVALPFLENGHSYLVEFFADLNQNGLYDDPPANHAWSMTLDDVSGDASLAFSHNTNFTNLNWNNLLTINFNDMTPHIGQMLELRVLEDGPEHEIGRVKRNIDMAQIAVEIPGIEDNKEYKIDFYADFNQNGLYDAPPADHAWQLSLNDHPAGDATLDFTHNTNFEDVDWRYLFTLNMMDMTPHLGQKFEVRLVETAPGDDEVTTFSMPAIMKPFFIVCLPGIELGSSYNVDFYADFNQNGTYDAPPTDHAWRLTFSDDEGDESLDFVHNTSFTDIMFPTAVSQLEALEHLEIFPNPFSSSLHLALQSSRPIDLHISLLNAQGQEIKVLASDYRINGQTERTFNGLEELPSGWYFLRLRNAEGQITIRPIVKK